MARDVLLQPPISSCPNLSLEQKEALLTGRRLQKDATNILTSSDDKLRVTNWNNAASDVESWKGQSINSPEAGSAFGLERKNSTDTVLDMVADAVTGDIARAELYTDYNMSSRALADAAMLDDFPIMEDSLALLHDEDLVTTEQRTLPQT